MSFMNTLPPQSKLLLKTLLLFYYYNLSAYLRIIQRLMVIMRTLQVKQINVNLVIKEANKS